MRETKNKLERPSEIVHMKEIRRDLTYLKLHSEEHCDVNSSLYVQMIKSRMRWVGHKACSGEERCIQGCGGKTTWKVYLEDLGMGGRIILKWIF